MRLWVKGVLFLSAYLPLFLIMTIKYYSEIIVAIFILIALLSFLSWVIVTQIAKTTTRETFKVLSAENRAKDALNYIIPYAISFIAFDFRAIPDLAAFGILMLVIFIIYIESSLVYLNPLLSLFGRRIFSIQAHKSTIGDFTEPETLLVLTTKNHFRKGEIFHIRRINEDFAMAK